MIDIDIGPTTFLYNSILNSVNKKGHSISHKHWNTLPPSQFHIVSEFLWFCTIGTKTVLQINTTLFWLGPLIKYEVPFFVESHAYHVIICYQEFWNWLPILSTRDSNFRPLHLTNFCPFIVPMTQLRQWKNLLKCKELEGINIDRET